MLQAHFGPSFQQGSDEEEKAIEETQRRDEHKRIFETSIPFKSLQDDQKRAFRALEMLDIDGAHFRGNAEVRFLLRMANDDEGNFQGHLKGRVLRVDLMDPENSVHLEDVMYFLLNESGVEIDGKITHYSQP